MSESVHPYLASSTISPNEAQLTVQEAGLLPSAIFGERKHLGKPHIWNESISVEEGRDLVRRRLRGGEPPWRRTTMEENDRGGGGERRGEMATTLFKLKLREDMTIELIALLLLHPKWSTQVESGGPQLHQL
ncbi:hypothetical protein AT5G28295 [Arabidopsis thaliana]|uniref:Uncharacterized protein n=1 Tax=Arabidopsis thaliana TaxID=3702 RepID=F4K730_ARATH|nr:uncharacterized protein AT5G28295 [Arabidopsis thaliana]AED93786.1 hypothetical protein AT5G28295 [Arabidopsis thaliana]|eukprot:NP_680232.1 hypothetical protein AT5G28295 [Arabidopsis thaliana]